MMSATSGPTSPKQFAEYDPDSSSWRTWPDTGLWGSTPFSGTWPRSGMTRSGRAYELPPSAHLTAGSASSSLLPTPNAGNFNDGEDPAQWEARRQRLLALGTNGNGMGTPLGIAVHLLPTPRTSDTNGPGEHGTGGPDLRTTVSLLPTPTTVNRTSARAQTGRPTSGPQRGGPSYGLEDVLLPTPTTEPATGNGHARNLGTEARLLPTPRATDGMKGGPNQRGSSGDLMLPSAVQLLPTPTVGDAKSTRNSTATRHRIPPTGIHAGDTLTDILVPVGDRTRPPSNAGKPSSDDTRPRPPSPDATADSDSPPVSSSG